MKAIISGYHFHIQCPKCEAYQPPQHDYPYDVLWSVEDVKNQRIIKCNICQFEMTIPENVSIEL